MHIVPQPREAAAGGNMPSFVRPWIALLAAFAPVLALAQQDPAAATSAGFGWVWIVAGAAIVLALFWLVFAGRRGPGSTPPARRP
jgi:hypothetical protein